VSIQISTPHGMENNRANSLVATMVDATASVGASPNEILTAKGHGFCPQGDLVVGVKGGGVRGAAVKHVML